MAKIGFFAKNGLDGPNYISGEQLTVEISFIAHFNWNMHFFVRGSFMSYA